MENDLSANPNSNDLPRSQTDSEAVSKGRGSDLQQVMGAQIAGATPSMRNGTYGSIGSMRLFLRLFRVDFLEGREGPSSSEPGRAIEAPGASSLTAS